MSIFNLNHTQTILTPEELEDIPRDARANLLEHVEKIEFIRNLISPNRRRVKDMPKDKNGKVIVDLENPHILEDVDYFRPCAIYFEKTGKYTDIFPNNSPGSEYVEFWDEQARRCKYGYSRPDGEWIPGEFYFYLNFCRIKVTRIKEGAERQEDGHIAAERVTHHPDFWDGDYLYFHYLYQAKMAGKHGMLLKTRGRGYSFKGGCLHAYDFYFWDGAASYAVASDEQYLIKDGLLTKAWGIIDDINEHTPWAKSSIPNTPMRRRAAYKDPDGETRGTLNEIIGVTLNNDPEKHRGKRGRSMLFEEIGKFPGLEKAWNIARDSFEEGGRVFGIMIAFGTGGSKGANFEGAKKFFYKPRGYNIHSIRNVYDKAAGKDRCSFWIGIYMNRADCYDKNGNSDVIKALIEVFKERDVLIKSGVDSSTIVQRKAENAITPQEAILRAEGSQFPILDIKDALSTIRANYESFISPHFVGMMIIRDGEIVFEQDPSLRPIHEYPVSDTENKTGAVEVFSPPAEGTQQLGLGDRYIIGIDPVRYDEVEYSISLASAFVFDLWLDEIVAEYTCRPEFVDDFNEQIYRLSVWYNAEINFENDITDIFTYFRNKNALYRLCDTPSIVKSMEIAREGRGNRSKGTPSGVKLNAQGRAWQSQWMKEKYKDSDEDEHVLNVHKIRSIAYLEEAHSWNPDGNFDRISAMNMVMILRMDKLLTLTPNMTMTNTGMGEDDEFFQETYDNKFGEFNPSSPNFDKTSLTVQEQLLLDHLKI